MENQFVSALKKKFDANPICIDFMTLFYGFCEALGKVHFERFSINKIKLLLLVVVQYINIQKNCSSSNLFVHLSTWFAN